MKQETLFFLNDSCFTRTEIAKLTHVTTKISEKFLNFLNITCTFSAREIVWSVFFAETNSGHKGPFN